MSTNGKSCKSSLKFDSNKYPEDALRNTIRLIFGPEDINPALAYVQTNLRPESYLKFDFAEYAKSCASQIDRANALKFILLEGIDDYRALLVNEIKDACDYHRIKMRGFSTPSALHEYQRAAACAPFIDAMEGKTDKGSIIRSTAEEACRTNGAPSACVQHSLEMDPRVYLLEYGWHNCAIKYMVHNRDWEVQREQMRSRLEQQFRRSFKLARDNCKVVNPW